MDVTLGAIFHIAIAVFLPLIFVRMFVFLTEYVQSMGPSINDVTSFSWLYDPSLSNVTTYLHLYIITFFPQFFTSFPLKIGDVIYGKPLCVEWVLFIASSRFIHRGIHNWHNFFANFDPLTPVQIIVANYR